MENVAAENGRVYFTGGPESVATANICLRTGERVMIELGSFDALSFEALFEGTRALPWERLIPRDGAFPVKGHSLSSKLFSVSDCQSIIKKAVVERLKASYGIEWFPETGPLYQIRFSIMKDRVSLCVDTTGDGLHKRGYRPAHNAAPLKETLAAAMVQLSRYRGRDEFCDPFCGSGTIPIEAALIAKNRAPGLMRSFSSMRWPGFEAEIWQRAGEAPGRGNSAENTEFSAVTLTPRPWRWPGRTPKGPALRTWSDLRWPTPWPLTGRQRGGSSSQIRLMASALWKSSRPKRFTGALCGAAALRKLAAFPAVLPYGI